MITVAAQTPELPSQDFQELDRNRRIRARSLSVGAGIFGSLRSRNCPISTLRQDGYGAVQIPGPVP